MPLATAPLSARPLAWHRGKREVKELLARRVKETALRDLGRDFIHAAPMPTDGYARSWAQAVTNVATPVTVSAVWTARS